MKMGLISNLARRRSWQSGSLLVRQRPQGYGWESGLCSSHGRRKRCGREIKQQSGVEMGSAQGQAKVSGERRAKRGRGKAVSWVVTERMERQSMDELRTGDGGSG